MYFLLSSIHYVKSRRAWMKQKRTALHMLALSGVVRPSHVEPRYATPITSISAFRAQPTSINHPKTPPIPLQPDNRNVTLNTSQVWQWTRNLPPVIVQFAKKPVVLPWTKQLDV